MIVKKWRGTDVATIQGLTQESRPSSDWPYAQDWILNQVHHDTVGRVYYVGGVHRDNGERFFYALYADRPMSWRYDLTHARMQIGRHETHSEALARMDVERQFTQCNTSHVDTSGRCERHTE